MNKLTVRLYNVRFGDGVLISVPDQDETGAPLMRHILIDVGNAASKAGGENEVFVPVFEDILRVLDGQPLDLYVATHEHLDHVQGLLWAASHPFAGQDLAAKLNARHVWLPASAHPDYYDHHSEAKKKLAEASDAYFLTQKSLNAAEEPIPEAVEALLRNNNRFLAAAGGEELTHARTADCVEYIRHLTSEANTHYVHRSIGGPSGGVAPFDLSGAHPFREAEFEIWAPEEDASEYYGSFRPVAIANVSGLSTGAGEATVKPPAGVDAGAFYNLVTLRQSGYVDNLLAIDKAANNSSIVFCLKWRGWKLLFPGDAEIRSWKEMNKEGALSPVHFLKVSHHGSNNGTPGAELLDKILPVTSPDGRERRAAVSTFPDTYSGIPHKETFDELRDLHGCELFSTQGLADGAALKIEFEGDA